jgi:hypothetical protein
MTQIRDKEGLAHEVNIDMGLVQEAYHEKVKLPQLLFQKFETDVEKYGTPFEQVLASNNMYLRPDRISGIKPPSMKDVLEGNVQIGLAGGPIVRPDGNAAQSISGRILFATVIEAMIESELMEDNTTYEGIFNSMSATTTTVDSPRVDQPIINLTAPRQERSMPIAQISEPRSMVTITLAEKSFRLPTFSIGLEISNEAQQATTLDLVGISLREQGIGERAAVVDESIVKLVNGDVDFGMSAIAAELITAYDPSITTNGVITQKSWLKWLRKDWKKLAIDWIITDIDTYLALEGRTGRPIITQDNGNDGRLNTLATTANPGIPDNVKVFLVEPTLLGANTIIGIDSSKAFRKVVNVSADYQAMEQFVLRKSTAFRIDHSFGYFRLFDQAWKRLTVATA